MATSFSSALLGPYETVTVLAAPEHDDIAVSQVHHKRVFEADLLAAPLSFALQRSLREPKLDSL